MDDDPIYKLISYFFYLSCRTGVENVLDGMKGSTLLSGKPPTSKKKLRKLGATAPTSIITDPMLSDTHLTGSFYIPPSPQRSSSFPVQKLINHLTKYRDNLGQVDMKKLDVITMDITSKSEDSELQRILKDHGWNGYRFVFSEVVEKHLASFLQQLSNLYLKQKSTFFANRITEMYGKEDASAFSQLASFSPNLLLHYIHSAQPSPSPSPPIPTSPTSTSSTLSPTQPPIHTPTSFSFTGACMLVDISGFSKFSGEMCKQGVTGLDGLREITNGFLGHFVKKVYEFDGDGKNIQCTHMYVFT
ncbi:hypothetical protein EON65_31475 [archaeon]|nr:MAG: hypothetical protein EON65_31475 [archaeon]